MKPKTLLYGIIMLLTVVSCSVINNDVEQEQIEFKLDKTELIFSSNGGELEIILSSNVDYTVDIPEEAEWLTHITTKTTTDKMIIIKASENTNEESRETTISIIAIDNTISQQVNIMQEPLVVTLTEEEIKAIEDIKEEDEEELADEEEESQYANLQGTQVLGESFDFEVSESFDWSIFKEIDIEISSNEYLLDGDTNTVEVYTKNDDLTYCLVDAGYITSYKPFRTEAMILSTIDELNVIIRDVDGKDIATKCPIIDNKVSDADTQYFENTEIENEVDLSKDVIYSDIEYTVAFEDIPTLGDMDLNDIVVKWQYGSKKNTENKIESVTLKYSIVAVGAGNQLAAAIRTNHLSESMIESVTLSKAQSFSQFFNVSNNIEIAGDEVVIPLFEDVHALFGMSSYNRSFVNTRTTSSYVEPYTFEVEIIFTEPISPLKFTSKDVDFFIVVDGNSSARTELHLFGKHPTVKADNDVDFSNSCQVWGLQLTCNYRWCIETMSILNAYPEFKTWATSGGASSKDWYNYPDETYVY